MTLRKPSSRWGLLSLVTGLLCLGLAGCSHHHKPTVMAHAAAPPPIRSTPRALNEVTVDDADFIATHKPIYSEEGVASWYGAPYHNRQSANGHVFDQNALTAAHRTLPMGSLIVVTNEKTRQSASMRVTDRGPFVPGRVLDLSMASAKATGVYRAGLAKVRIDVYQTPKPMEAGGRWCVQIGAFDHERKATKLRDQLERRYRTARVIDFAGPTGHWVRIRPEGDNREQAELIQRKLRPSEGDAYLVRLD